jgi:carboxypeptidase C (cathepsin A)
MAAAVIAAPKEDLMGKMPLTTDFDSPTYSGYLSASETKKLHYVFTESLDSPSTDPILIWFNGGPGCSSMLGFIQENGPRVVNDGEDYLLENKDTWNTRANVLWLESPAGVGWSTGTKEDQTTDDLQQSIDALAALQDWYVKFPEFKSNELFISGESYAGIYVPYLAYQIDLNNRKSDYSKQFESINLKGYMVGNGCTDWTFDSTADTATYANFNIIPQSWWNQYTELNCYSGPVELWTKPKSCIPLQAKIQAKVSKLNWYDLYRPLLNFKLGEEDRMGETVIDGEVKTYKRGMTMQEYTPWAGQLETNEPQIRLNDFVTDYMNLPETREAFNIPSDVPAWQQCSNIDYTIGPESSRWIYPLLKDKYRMMFYSGDTDAAVATYGSKQWINDLGWKVVDEWRTWETNGQVSGFTEKRDGLDFYTIKGVGHMAPQWKRGPVNNMIMSWIHGQPL